VTPDARILDYSVVLDDEPALAEYNQRIINTLQKLADSGKRRHTIKSTKWHLRKLNRLADLMNPEAEFRGLTVNKS